MQARHLGRPAHIYRTILRACNDFCEGNFLDAGRAAGLRFFDFLVPPAGLHTRAALLASYGVLRR